MKTLEKLLQESRMHPNESPTKSDADLSGLLDLIKEHVTKDTIMVEIGSHIGVSTELFAMHCKKIHTIDCWYSCGERYDGETSESRGNRRRARVYNGISRERYEEICRKRLESYGNVKIIKDFSANVSKSFENESVDMVYIDGGHKYNDVVEDIKAWTPKVKRGGLISGHDWHWEGVRKAVLELSEGKYINKYKDSSWGYLKNE